jgi:hypothetical protein
MLNVPDRDEKKRLRKPWPAYALRDYRRHIKGFPDTDLYRVSDDEALF